MKHNSIKSKRFGRLVVVALVLILAAIFQGCTTDRATNEDIERLPNEETEWLYWRILHIYDAPQDTFTNHTITACNVASDVDCGDVEYVSNHLHLHDIGVEVGSHVRVEVPALRSAPFPGRPFIFDWELID